VIVIAVRTAEQVERALFDTDGVVSGLRSGSLVVLTSTVGVESARGLVARLREVGAGLVDAPISGSPARAAAGDLLVLASGSTGALAMAMPVLERLARKVVVVGDAPGDGQAVKIVNQLLCGVHIAAAAEALKLADALGLDLEKTLAALGEGAAASFMLGERGERIIAALRTGRSDFRSRLDIFDKDMELVTDAAMTSRLELHLAEAARELYRVAEHTGLGTADDSNVVLAIGSRGSGDG
jgi:3-hydroxyisobutyrate dehydrogenase